MSSDDEWHEYGHESYTHTGRPARRAKRRKVSHNPLTKAVVSVKVESASSILFSLEPLMKALHEQSATDWEDDMDYRDSFEGVLEPLLSEMTDADNAFWMHGADLTKTPPGSHILSSQEAAQLLENLPSRSLPGSNDEPSVASLLLAAKARTHSRLLRRVILDRDVVYPPTGPLTPMRAPRIAPAANPQVLDALYAIQTTPYESSFLSRLDHSDLSDNQNVIAVDWEACTPWMDLMSDIREHYTLAHPEREQVVEELAPVTYCTLQRCHLVQVHDLLRTAFWDGIDVSDSLEFSPEKCTIVATYKRLVVGAAFLSSPQETYITYLAVRSGWDNSQIATSMLYHLITLNPRKDITLHVSITNPAMLLYNRFGFKAEEFIVGFYEDYLDPNSPQSKNAFRLRLRRW